MRHSLAGALIGLLLLLAGCQAPPRPVQSEAPADTATLARHALEGGRYAEALELYRRALGEAPGKVSLHYGLGVASSYLDRRDDAIREFRWVVQYGVPATPEVAAARQWLVRARALVPAALVKPVVSRPGEERQPGNASLEGRAVFAEPGQEPRPMSRLQLMLVGQPDSPTAKERYNLRTDEEGSFKFPNVVPGPYKLTDRVAGRPLWRLRVEVRPSDAQILELTPTNSTTVRDDFPEQHAQAQD